MKINKNTKNNIKVRLKYHKEKQFKKNKHIKNVLNVITKKKYNYINNDDINAYDSNNYRENIYNITNVVKIKNRKSLILQWDYEHPCDK
jgi:hypothetical protein